MSNTGHLQTPMIPRGDMGLGLCAGCLNELARAVAAVQAKQADRVQVNQPEFAITLSPEQIPLLTPDGQLIGFGVAALPSCFRHFAGAQAVASGSGQAAPLLVPPAGFRVPKTPGG